MQREEKLFDLQVPPYLWWICIEADDCSGSSGSIPPGICYSCAPAPSSTWCNGQGVHQFLASSSKQDPGEAEDASGKLAEEVVAEWFTALHLIYTLGTSWVIISLLQSIWPQEHKSKASHWGCTGSSAPCRPLSFPFFPPTRGLRALWRSYWTHVCTYRGLNPKTSGRSTQQLLWLPGTRNSLQHIAACVCGLHGCPWVKKPPPAPGTLLHC